MVLHKNLLELDDNLHVPKSHTHVEAHITDLDKYTQAEVDALIASVVGDYLPLAAGDANPLTGDLYIDGPSAGIRLRSDGDTEDYSEITESGTAALRIRRVSKALTGPAYILLDPVVFDLTSDAEIHFFGPALNTSGQAIVKMFRGTGGSSIQHQFFCSDGDADLCRFGGVIRQGGEQVALLSDLGGIADDYLPLAGGEMTGDITHVSGGGLYAYGSPASVSGLWNIWGDDTVPNFFEEQVAVRDYIRQYNGNLITNEFRNTGSAWISAFMSGGTVGFEVRNSSNDPNHYLRSGSGNSGNADLCIEGGIITQGGLPLALAGDPPAAHAHFYEDTTVETVTNGDPVNPEVLFDIDGDVVTIETTEVKVTYG
jgi:hypothetical protein